MIDEYLRMRDEPRGPPLRHTPFYPSVMFTSNPACNTLVNGVYIERYSCKSFTSGPIFQAAVQAAVRHAPVAVEMQRRGHGFVL